MYMKYFILKYVIMANVILSSFAAHPELSRQEECAARAAVCEKAGTSKRAVCGTDNKTYLSRCQLTRAACLGLPVAFKHKGPCTDAQPCFVSLKYARGVKRGGSVVQFVPKCRNDGFYASVQCHAETGCWCVTQLGKPIPNTSVRNGKPKCSTTGKSHTRRRSSTRGQRQRKNCSRADKRQFNANLLKIFATEYERGRRVEPPAADRNRLMAEWKFTEMDKDKSGTLQKLEYRGIRRIVKKVVKPKRCARTFVRTCDLDHDEVITKQEWTSCLTGDGLNYEEGPIEQENKEPDYNEEDTDLTSSLLPGSLIKSQLPEPTGTAVERKDDLDSNDCLSDRKTVLEEQKNGDVLYVPECTSDGRYQRVQCYHSTGYCWCVHEDTGKPIPGSSVKDQNPKCEAIPTLERPMKGCPEQAKTNFLHDLMSLFQAKMVSSTNGTMSGSADIIKWQASKEEQVATWIYVMLDKDKNKMLDRREWKAYHALIAGRESLKKCGKKLPRYCDVNHDRKISITEWLTCLNAQRVSHYRTTTTPEPRPLPSMPTKRRGPNPLEKILKADD